MQYVSLTLFSLVLYVICFVLFFSFLSFFLNRYHAVQGRILICGKYNQVVLSMFSEKHLSFKYLLLLFRLIFNSQKKKRKRKTSVVRDEREAITPV